MKLTKQRLKQLIYEEIAQAEPSRFDPTDVAEEKKCDAGEHRCTSGGKCTKKACNHPVGVIASVDLKEKIELLVRKEFESIFSEGNKASKTVGDPPYRERGSTESQAQQKAAGMALSARRGDTPVSKLKGAALDLYNGEITTKELRNLAKLGQKVKQHKSKEPKHLKSLPGHVTPAED